MRPLERPPNTARASQEPAGGDASAKSKSEFPPALQFANTAVGDTALALSPSIVLTSERSVARDPNVEAPPAPPLSGDLGPYTIVRQVGAGGMGAVYEATDRRSGARVAVKSLLRLGAGDLHRFKYEFRSMAGVGHPNLVTLYELVSHAGTWCITMEFVDGVDLCHALRRRAGDGAGLRALIRQLALAIQTLHANNLLHRDLKPSNVLVTGEDRVVVLDFGLVAEISRTGFSQAPVHAGTPLYMAPEQCASQLATPASDWYALGVMLYEAITGRLPFTGTAAAIFAAKQVAAPPIPDVPDNPALAALIAALLRRDPAERASAAHVLAWCDGVAAPLLGPVTAVASTTPAATTIELAGPNERESDAPVRVTQMPSQFGPTARHGLVVGRLAERAALAHAYSEAQSGRPTSIYLRGLSGTGKTVLGQRFLAELAEQGDAVILAGRCYEHESVPFKAFDSIIDALTDHLLTRPSEALGPLLGAHSGELARVFPALERIPMIRHAAQAFATRQAAVVRRGHHDTASTEHTSRRRAFAALKRLLYALAVRAPLVIAIDDLHWSDVDSLHLLNEVLAPPDVPPLLLIGAYRSDWPGSPAALRELEQIQLRVTSEQNMYRLELGPLPAAEALGLARSLLHAAGLPAESWAEAIAKESAGNPFLITAVTRHLAREPGAFKATKLGTSVDLSALIQMRIARLEPPVRALLELIAVAGQPVPAGLLAAAEGQPAGIDAWLATLHSERLIFLGQRGRERSVECAHDRLREVVVANLDAARALELHRRLATTAVATGRLDPEFLARHLHAAGDHYAAAEHAERAAKAASEALAFDRAAELYHLALRSAPGSWRLMAACADAKVNAGRVAEAAPLYHEASVAAPPTVAFGLRRRACEQFFVSGESEQAVTVLRGLLGELGITYPEASEDIHRQFVAVVAALAQDQPGPHIATTASSVAVDTLWSACKGFLIHSPVRGAYFAAASALLARKLGDEGRLVRGLIALQAVLTHEQDPQIFAFLHQRTRAYITTTEDHYLIGLSSIMDGVAAALASRWGEALHALEFGNQHLLSHCPGVSWECNFGLLMLMSLLETRGELRSIAHRNAVLAQQAKEAGNSMMAFVSAYYSALTRMAGDAIAQARAEVRQAGQVGLRQELPAAHLRALMIETHCDLYCGEINAAWARIEAAWSHYEKWRVLTARSQRINASGLRAQVALARARLCSSAEERSALLSLAADERRTLEATATPQAKAIAALLRAMAAAAQGRRPATVIQRLQAALRAFEDADMALHAACISYRLGEWIGGSGGAEQRARAEAFMRLQAIVRPQRWVAMCTPNLAPLAAGPQPSPP